MSGPARNMNTADWVQEKGLEGLAANGDPGVASGTSIFDPVLCELAYRWFSPVGGLVLDLARRSVTAEGTLLPLTLREFQLLQFLMTHRCRVFTREALLTQVWGSNFEGDERVVDATIKRVRGLGYRFVPEALDHPSL